MRTACIIRAMEAARTSETSIHFHETTAVHSRNLSSSILTYVFPLGLNVNVQGMNLLYRYLLVGDDGV
jgi:hypothetical protein